MKVILKSDVKKVGKKGEIVDVSDGYARNFLIARGLAVPSTDRSLEILAHQKEEEKKEDDKRRAEAQALADKLSTMIFNFHVKSGSEGRVFGSVSTKQIVEELAKQDIKVDKKKFIDTAPINSLGVTKVRVDLYRGVIATIACNLIGSE
ncbi:MAG: 50S ribosomal protein L9 [Solobacterium sp.]|nr:50S ribosomal protein L9 [Solobacterium sp.]